ncbi:MAG: hypothetical protein JJE47_00045 [Acidimicrobiia bacterium]|nr:hypothetical protein [Acidimicrobiia bacterium]
MSKVPARIAGFGGVVLGTFGLWAMILPESFFDQLARFEPYNQHFIQDIGAFQIGLGAVLLLAMRYSDSLAAGLLGVGTGSAAHLVSHAVGTDLGGTPALDIPVFAVLSAVLLVGGVMRVRHRLF